MARIVLWILGGWTVLFVVLALIGWRLNRKYDNSWPAARRLNGLCAVPGCGRPAGHWKVIDGR